MDYGPYRIPNLRSLIVFESAARHGNFSKAAGELHTSQPAVSRHIASLEEQLSTKLFERSRSGVTLTDAGERFRDAVVAGLRVIHSGVAEAISQSDGKQVVITCSHDISHLVIFPRFDALQDAVGEETRVRLLTYRDDPREQTNDPLTDVEVIWSKANPFPDMAAEETAILFNEEVQLICSPDFAAAHAETLAKPMTEWSGLTVLDFKRPNQGWITWTDWCSRSEQPFPPLLRESFDTYIQVLEAAATGRGVALGWRTCIDPYLDTGALVMLDDAFVQFDGRLFAALTAKGRKNPFARTCFVFFMRWAFNRGT